MSLLFIPPSPFSISLTFLPHIQRFSPLPLNSKRPEVHSGFRSGNLGVFTSFFPYLATPSPLSVYRHSLGHHVLITEAPIACNAGVFPTVAGMSHTTFASLCIFSPPLPFLNGTSPTTSFSEGGRSSSDPRWASFSGATDVPVIPRTFVLFLRPPFLLPPPSTNINMSTSVHKVGFNFSCRCFRCSHLTEFRLGHFFFRKEAPTPDSWRYNNLLFPPSDVRILLPFTSPHSQRGCLFFC